MSDPVLEQYEAYPYPARNPLEERKRLITGSPSNLPEVSHYVFAGRPRFEAGFRALAAGGGTGDAAIMMAQQLADQAGPRSAGEVLYLDPSRAARRIAEARAGERKLDNISFHTGSLLDLADLGHGPFDYIDCCGVLHHLEDPAAGLAALAKVLAPGGGMGLMLYAPYGRSGVYPAQDMLRTLAPGQTPAERVAVARRLLDALPPTNWLKLNPFIGDHRRSDAELFDLLLHARDRAYRVPEVMELVAGAGLRLVTFIEPARYDPATYLKDPALLKRLDGLGHPARAAFAENLAGNMKKHVFYVVAESNAADTVARPDSPTCVPVLREVGGKALARAIGPDLTLKFDLDGLPLRVPMPRLASAILSRVDGTASLGRIHAALRELDGGLDWGRFKAQFDSLYKALNGLNHLLIRRPPAET